MKKILIAVLFLFIGTSLFAIEVWPIFTSERMLQRQFDRTFHRFAYTAYLFSEDPTTDWRSTFDLSASANGLRLREFPRSNSVLDRILWESLTDFVNQSGARQGDYVLITISTGGINDSDWRAQTSRNSDITLIFMGRFEVIDRQRVPQHIVGLIRHAGMVFATPNR